MIDTPGEDTRDSKCVACSVTVRERRWASGHGTKEPRALSWKYKFSRDPWGGAFF